MSSPFLIRFAHRVLERLIAESLVELEPNTEVRIVDFLANWLASRTEGTQLLSSLERGLLTCPDIHELYADRDTLKVVVEGLERT